MLLTGIEWSRHRSENVWETLTWKISLPFCFQKRAAWMDGRYQQDFHWFWSCLADLRGIKLSPSPHYALRSFDDSAVIHHIRQKCWAGNNFMRCSWGGWDWCGDKRVRSRHEDPFGRLAVDVGGSDSSWSFKYSQPELLRVTLNRSSFYKHTETNGLIFSSGTLSDSPDRTGNCFSSTSYLSA